MHTLKAVSAVSAIFLLVACAPAKEVSEQTLASASPQTTVVQQAVIGQSSEQGLASMLTNQLGINQQQAMGGAGSIFALAQQRMKPDDFMQLSSSVPDMDQYLSAVPQSPKSSTLLGSAAGLMGGQNSGLGNLAGLAGSFQNLGMDTALISRFVPVVLNYVQGQGGAGAMSLLQNALY